jgi:hypothetical protein
VTVAQQRIHNPQLYEYEVYDDGAAGWAWIARHDGRVLILSANHPSEFDANVDLDRFKRTTKL